MSPSFIYRQFWGRGNAHSGNPLVHLAFSTTRDEADVADQSSRLRRSHVWSQYIHSESKLCLIAAKYGTLTAVCHLSLSERSTKA